MNQKDYERYKQEVLSKVRIRPIEGAVRPSGKESKEHFLKKAELVWSFNNANLENLPLYLQEHFVGEDLRNVAAFCEVRFSEKVIADVLVILRGKTVVIEVLESEKDTDSSIKRKQRAYMGMGFDFAVY